MSHREIYYVRCKVENVNGHKSTSKMITIRGRKTTHNDMRTTDEITLATLKLILCMLAVFAQLFLPHSAATFVRYYVLSLTSGKRTFWLSPHLPKKSGPDWWVQLMYVERNEKAFFVAFFCCLFSLPLFATFSLVSDRPLWKIEPSMKYISGEMAAIVCGRHSHVNAKVAQTLIPNPINKSFVL